MKLNELQLASHLWLAFSNNDEIVQKQQPLQESNNVSHHALKWFPSEGEVADMDEQYFDIEQGEEVTWQISWD